MFFNSASDITVTNVVSANRLLKSPVGVTTQRKNRERWAIALKLGGKTFYVSNGKEILSDRLHPVILPKGCTYSWKCAEPGECIIIEFDAIGEEHQVIPFEISDNSFIINTFSKIERGLHMPRANNGLELKYLLYGLLLFLSKTAGKEYLPKETVKTLQPAIEFISEKYYDSSITNDCLSALCGVSTVYFRKIFKNSYGVSPIRYLHNFRINKAKAILLSDYESIDQISESVGYNSVYHFSKMFKSYTGMSPTEYAKAFRK